VGLKNEISFLLKERTLYPLRYCSERAGRAQNLARVSKKKKKKEKKRKKMAPKH
jgi:hypothetical protein